ncbi:hypothetical protein BKA57DRAFT_517812 [Linnemannia elongata]|nr:hypothetical protein BKA57DRAFT_517812 [Linnemannia elongata]
MGIRGLPKELHESGGVAGVSCKEEGKSTHVDFLCRFFRLLQARAFHILQQHVKTGSNSVTETPAPELQLETEVAARSRKRKNIAEHNPSSNTPSLDVTIPFDAKRTLDELIEDSIDRLGYKKLFLNPDGLSPVDMKNQQTFRAIAFILDDIMSKGFDKEATVIHVDGSPSEQKRGEHRRRNKTLERSLNNLQTKDASDPDAIVVVTSDSDLMVYEGIRHIMMPVGKSRELQLFDKTKLLDRLDLPSEQHLLLACIVTSNDYVKNLPYFGLLRNCDIIRDFDLTSLGPLGGSRDNNYRAEALMPFIQQYLDEVRRQLGKRKTKSTQQTSTRRQQQEIIQIAEYFRHAVTAFVERMETPLQVPLEPDDESPHSHDIITTILQELYSRKNQQQQSQQSRNDIHTFIQRPPSEQVSTVEPCSAQYMDMDTNTNIESELPSTSAHQGFEKVSKGTRKRRRSLKHQQRRKDRFKAKRSEAKHKQWRQSQFKSRTDIQKRYSIKTVDIHAAPKVDEAELAKMTVPKPRVRKQSTPSIKSTDSSNDKDTSKATNGSSSQQKSSTNSRQKNKKRKPRKSKSAVCQLKSGFSGTFATSTQTIGSVHGCMRRALLPAHETGRLALLDEKDIQDMAARINSAVSTMAEARMFVFRAVEIIILDKLLGASDGEDGSEALDAVAGEEDAEATFDVLELILEKNAGTAIVKHLFSLILNGKIERGPPTVKQESKAAKEMSMAAFHRLCQILPGFQPVNKDSICLGRLVVDAAAEFSLQLRKHFRDMPFTIGRRVLFDCLTLK